jgi:hypothetical protein
MRYLYQYSPTDASRSDATERQTLDAETLGVLQEQGEYNKFVETVSIEVSNKLPAQSDISIEAVAGANTSLVSRNAQWPESWVLDSPAAGAISFSQVSNTSLVNAQGMPVKSTLSLVKKGGETIEILKAAQIVGDIVYDNNGTGEIELRSIWDNIYRSTVGEYSVYGNATVNYTDEYWIYIITDLLMNCGVIDYAELHYNNIPYLFNRFCGVFGVQTYSTSDLDGTTIADILADIGPILGLCCTQMTNGCISVWHPAVYRTSMRVWTIDADDCIDDGYSVVKRGKDGQYGYARITNTDSGSGYSTQTIKYPPVRYPRRVGSSGGEQTVGFRTVEYSTTANPSTTNAYGSNQLPSAPGFVEYPYEFTAKGQAFIDYGSARAALGRQLMQRLGTDMWECELRLGLRGLAIDIGDVVKLTGPGLDATTRFLIISDADLTAGEVTIKGVHYPAALAIASTFEDTGIEGEWRWLNQAGSQSTANQAPDGSDSDPSTTTLATLSYEHWQGAMHSAGYTEWAADPLISASKHDVLDVCTMVAPEIDGAVANIAGWKDEEYVPIAVWRKASGNEAMAFGIYRPGYSLTNDVVNNELFVAHINDYTAGTFTFTAVAYSANGVCGRDAGTSDVPAAFALQWDDSDNVNLYVDRQLLVEGTGFSKSNWNQLRIMTQTDIKIGCVRHLQTDEEITELQRLQGLNGLDPYQP